MKIKNRAEEQINKDIEERKRWIKMAVERISESKLYLIEELKEEEIDVMALEDYIRDAESYLYNLKDYASIGRLVNRINEID